MAFEKKKITKNRFPQVAGCVGGGDGWMGVCAGGGMGEWVDRWERSGWKGGGPNCRTSMMQMISNAVYHTFLAQRAALYLLAQAE